MTVALIPTLINFSGNLACGRNDYIRRPKIIDNQLYRLFPLQFKTPSGGFEPYTPGLFDDFGLNHMGEWLKAIKTPGHLPNVDIEIAQLPSHGSGEGHDSPF